VSYLEQSSNTPNAQDLYYPDWLHRIYRQIQGDQNQDRFTRELRNQYDFLLRLTRPDSSLVYSFALQSVARLARSKNILLGAPPQELTAPFATVGVMNGQTSSSFYLAVEMSGDFSNGVQDMTSVQKAILEAHIWKGVLLHEVYPESTPDWNGMSKTQGDFIENLGFNYLPFPQVP